VKDLSLLREASQDDSLTIPPKEVIAKVTALLGNKADLDADTVAVLLWQRGHAYLNERLTDKALADFERLCILRPNDLKARCRLAHSLALLGQTKEAIAQYDKVLAQDANCACGHLGVSWMQFAACDYEGAWQTANKALKLDARCYEAYLVLAGVDYKRKRLDAALETINRYIAFGPVTVGPYCDHHFGIKAVLLIELHRPKEALSSALLGLKVKPDSELNMECAAWAYAELKKWSAAAKWAHALVEKYPQCVSGLFKCAEIDCELGDRKSSLAYLAKARKLMPPGDAECLAGVAHVYKKLGSYDLARKHYERAVDAKAKYYYPKVALAELLAAHPDENKRNVAEAEQLLTEIPSNLSKYDLWQVKRVTAIINAEKGEYEVAIKLIRETIELVGTESGWRAELTQMLDLFDSKKPFRLKPADPQVEQ
jgi:tetratricopeptide (TPR) repeat protein